MRCALAKRATGCERSIAVTPNHPAILVFVPSLASTSGRRRPEKLPPRSVIHDYLFSEDGDTFAALRLGPGASSSLLEKREQWPYHSHLDPEMPLSRGLWSEKR
jgi:hypothetical protein